MPSKNSTGCYTYCPTGYYGDNSTGLCLSCFGSCQLCKGPAATDCLSCPSGQYLDVSTCVT